MESFNPFTFDGRIGRLQYFGYGIIWGIIFLVVALIIASGTGAAGKPSAGGALLYLALMIVDAIATLSYGARRLHDFDKSGWWYLLMFIPFVNVVMAFVLLLAPGTQGANSYGLRVR